MKLLFFLTISIGLFSCEGFRCAEGKIVDSETLTALDSVTFTNLTGNGEGTSDSTGYYDLCNQISGCVPECKDIEIEFSKEGYKSKTYLNPEMNELILLEKE